MEGICFRPQMPFELILQTAISPPCEDRICLLALQTAQLKRTDICRLKSHCAIAMRHDQLKEGLIRIFDIATAGYRLTFIQDS